MKVRFSNFNSLLSVVVRTVALALALGAAVCFSQEQPTPFATNGWLLPAISVSPSDQTWSRTSRRLVSVAYSDGVYLAVWEDYRNAATGADIYGARITTGGNVLDPVGIPISVGSGKQSRPRVAACGGMFLVVWGDSRNADTGLDVYGCRVTVSGTLLDPNGLVIAKAAGDQHMPSIAGSAARWLVVYNHEKDPAYDIYGTFVEPSGGVIQPGGFPVCAASAVQSMSAVGSNGTDFFVAWHDYRNASSRDLDVYGTRVTATGSVTNPQGLLIAGAAAAQWFPHVASNGDTFLVTWHDQRNETSFMTNTDVYGARISAGGGVMTPNPISISRSKGNQRDPVAAAMGGDYLVVWTDDRDAATGYDIVGTTLSGAGVAGATNGFPLSQQPFKQDHPTIAAGPNGQFLVTHWAEDTNTSAFKIIANICYIREPEVVLDQPVVGANGARLRWTSVPRLGYRVQAAEAFPAIWRDLDAGFQADSVVSEVLDAAPVSGARFYRVIRRGP